MCGGEVHANSTRFLHSSLFPPGQVLGPRVSSLGFYGSVRAPAHARGGLLAELMSPEDTSVP